MSISYKAIHFRLARNCLKISQKEVEKATKISVPTVCRMEIEDREVEKAKFSTIRKLVEFYQNLGVIFLFEEGGLGGDGVIYDSKKNPKKLHDKVN